MREPLITPVRIQLSRAKGFRLQEASRAINGLPTVNCARPSLLGNPFTKAAAWDAGYLRGITDDDQREFLCIWFKRWLNGSETFWHGEESDARRAAILARLPTLIAHNLACWCPLPSAGDPDHCHAAVLLEIANA